MSNTPQGPGWWAASDGKWYPPEAATPPPPPPTSSTSRPLATVGTIGSPQFRALPVAPARRAAPSGSASRVGSFLAMGAGALVAVSAFLPWISDSGASVGGAGVRDAFQLGSLASFGIDGELLVVFGAVMVAAGIARLVKGETLWWMSSAVICLGIFTAVLCLDHYVAQGAFSALNNGTSVGYGLFVALVGGILAFVSGIFLRAS
jgi:hypothetical protein